MKAGTAKERAVEALTAQYVRPLTEDQVRAVHGVSRPDRYVLCPGNTRNKGFVWCANCGHVLDFRPGLLINQGVRPVCEHCGATLRDSRDARCGVGHANYEDNALVVLAETHEDWQIFRYFHVCSMSFIGREVTLFRPVEVVRRYYNVVHGGKEVVWSVGLTGMMYSTWNFNQPLSLKHEGARSSYYGTRTYKFIPDAWAPCGTWHKLLKRDGLHGESSVRLLDLAPHEVVPVFTCPQLVTMIKAHKYKMARYYSGGAGSGFKELREDWPSIKVALRRGYVPTDPQLWHDLLHDLRDLRRDVLSPRWICPENLHLAHDLAEAQAARVRRLLAKEEERDRARKAEKTYKRHIAAFASLKLRGVGFSIAVIPTVEDVWIEGEKMHHCVFQMRYYERETSLLLSAKDGAGKRLETIEFSLDSGKVLQSRAACNLTSPKHNEILAIMEENAAEIQRMWRRAMKKPSAGAA